MTTYKLLELQELLQKATDALDVILQETAFQNELKEITKAEGKDTDVPTKNEPKADVPDTNVGKWIPVSERLPKGNGKIYGEEFGENLEESEPVLVCGYYKRECEIGIGRYIYNHNNNESGWNGYLDCECDIDLGHCEVVAWMPLPEPYKEDNNE